MALQPPPPDAAAHIRQFLSEPEEHAWLTLVEVHARVSRALEQALERGHHIPKNAFDLLMRIAHDPAVDVTISELAADAAVGQSQVSRIIIDLERRGLVTRGRKASDARATCVRMTPAGFEFLAAAAPAYLGALRAELFDHLGAGDAERLGVLLGRALPQQRRDDGGHDERDERDGA